MRASTRFTACAAVFGVCLSLFLWGTLNAATLKEIAEAGPTRTQTPSGTQVVWNTVKAQMDDVMAARKQEEARQKEAAREEYVFGVVVAVVFMLFMATVVVGAIAAVVVVGRAGVKKLNRRREARAALWDSVCLGMSQDEILALFGQPSKVEPTQAGDHWTWGLGKGRVIFKDGNVTGYTKPVGP